MAQIKSPKAQEFDTLIVGGGLSGLLSAHVLESTGRNVLLVESMETLGGSSRAGQTKAGPVDHGLKLFPATPETHAALDWLESIIEEKIERTEIEAAPITYDDGKFKPYVGFGAATVETASEIEVYAVEKRLLLSSTPKDWVQKLAQTYTGSLMTQSYATKFIVDDTFIIETLLNGSKRICAHEIIFAAPPQQLPDLLGEGTLPARVRQKLNKGDFWTSVNLDIVHGHVVTDSQAVHILKGANEEPTIGVFHPPQADGLQVSQWFTLIPRDQVDEEELVAAALKHIKRQVKRAYESSFIGSAGGSAGGATDGATGGPASGPAGLVQERILVVPGSHGSLLGQFDPPGRLPKIDNLWIVSALFSRSRNTVGAILETQRILSELGPAPTRESERQFGPHTVTAEA